MQGCLDNILSKMGSHLRHLLVSVTFLLLSGFVAHAASDIPLPSPQTISELPADGGPQFNRLIFETSPYLQQHATNPIDWYAWGEEALAKARKENKPIFLSIGYSTCHWCHVMEKESYADAEVGRLMNQFFVAIKVDREERPDLDHLYMSVCHRMSGNCGWPLNVILTPDQKPFFAGTYFPKEDRHGRPGMLRLLPQIDQVWKTRRQDIDRLSEQVVTALKQDIVTTSGDALELADLHLAYEQLSKMYDSEHGGIGGPPKFPKPLSLGFLLRYWQRSGKADALEMVETTLQAMRRGGIYDHIGFGFHRYATDAQWQVPHFEKMLYNQALLLMLYTDAYQITGNALYAQTVREITTYVLRDMTSSEGGFYSAEDADSEGEEGLFYFWTQQDILKLLNADDAALFAQVFNIEPNGNFREGAAKRFNIPHLKRDVSGFASQTQTSEVDLRRRLDRARQRLFMARKARVHPFKDDKILTDWNGLMIAALAKAGQALNEPAYIHAARRGADFVLSQLRNAEGRLLKRYRGGQAGLAAHVDDYAYLIWGLIDLYEASFDLTYLQTAVTLQHDMLTLFWDDKDGGFFITAGDQPQLLIRSKDIQDMALPSGNSVAAMNLLRLERITTNQTFAARASRLLQVFAHQVTRYPAAHTLLMSVLNFSLGPSFEVVISGFPEREDTTAMLQALRQPFLPNKVVLFRPSHTDNPGVVQLAPYTKDQLPLNGQATAYVCQNFVCRTPTTDIKAMLTALTVPMEAAGGAEGEVTEKPK